MEMNEIDVQQKSLQLIEKFEKKTYEIIREINKAAYKKINTLQIINKYGYIIHRILREAKLFTLLTIISTD